MKNLIIMLLVVCLCVMAGCDEEELIEISGDSRSAATIQNADFEEPDKNTMTSENSDNEAGSLEDNSRPLVVVYVCGEVKCEGVYTLEEGSRVIDAIIEAGGYTVDACETYLNLAAGLSDSQMIYVPSKEEMKSGTFEESTQVMLTTGTGMFSGTGGTAGISGNSSGSNAGGGNSGGSNIGGNSAGGSNIGGNNAGGLVNINLATKEQLMSLPGIGESKADKIIAYRESNGGFSSTEEIMQISGIKDGLYNKVKDKICVR